MHGMPAASASGRTASAPSVSAGPRIASTPWSTSRAKPCDRMSRRARARGRTSTGAGSRPGDSTSLDAEPHGPLERRAAVGAVDSRADTQPTRISIEPARSERRAKLSTRRAHQVGTRARAMVAPDGRPTRTRRPGAVSRHATAAPFRARAAAAGPAASRASASGFRTASARMPKACRTPTCARCSPTTGSSSPTSRRSPTWSLLPRRRRRGARADRAASASHTRSRTRSARRPSRSSRAPARRCPSGQRRKRSRFSAIAPRRTGSTSRSSSGRTRHRRARAPRRSSPRPARENGGLLVDTWHAHHDRAAATAPPGACPARA